MQAIIIAAGEGSRLKPLTNNMPKNILQFEDNSTILGNQIEALSAVDDIDGVTLVVGYKESKIESFLDENGHTNFVDTVYNPFYKESENLVSVWLATLVVNENFLITNGDNIFERTLIEEAVNSMEQDGAYLLTNYKKEYDDDDMRVSTDDGNVIQVNKQIDDEFTDMESISIAAFTGNKADDITNLFDEMVRSDKHHYDYWLTVFDKFKQRGGTVKPIVVDEHRWEEMDTPEDKALIEERLAEGWLNDLST